jgi:2'-5' RNA ligase
LVNFQLQKFHSKKFLFFPKGDDGFPVIVPIISDDLIEVRKSLAKAFDKDKINYSKKWPKFNPHITLAYSKKEPTDRKIDKSSWNATELVLYAGDKFEFSKFESGMFIFMPFGKKASSEFEMIRLASFIFGVEQLNSSI